MSFECKFYMGTNGYYIQCSLIILSSDPCHMFNNTLSSVKGQYIYVTYRERSLYIVDRKWLPVAMYLSM